MKSVTLENIRDCLENLEPVIEVEGVRAERARRALLAMLEIRPTL
jgi:quinolinate synthase